MKPMNVTSHDTSGLREKMTLPKAVKGESQLLVNLSTTEFPAHCQTASGQKPPSQIAAYEQKSVFFLNCQNDQNVKGAFKQIKLRFEKVASEKKIVFFDVDKFCWLLLQSRHRWDQSYEDL